MATRFFAKDTVALAEDTTILGVVELTWRDTEPGDLHHPADWINHNGVSRELTAQCRRERKPPENHVVVKFLDPYSGDALVAESALVLVDRGIVLGDVFKRSVSDVESGMAIRTYKECVLQPIYTGLPYHGPGPWPYREEDNRIRAPSHEIQFLDYEVGDHILYRGWIGEIIDFREEVTVRLKNGSVVRVKDAEDLLVPAYKAEASQRQSLARILQRTRENLRSASSKDGTEPASIFYPGQVVFTKKSNLRLGNWVIGSYSASEAAQGIVVDVRVIELEVDWYTANVFDRTRPMRIPPPALLTTDELDEVKRYKLCVSSDGVGLAQTREVLVGDVVKFRDITCAAAKYSENSPDRGFFRRIPREITQGFNMNVFMVKGTESSVTVQWQDGSTSTHKATALVPYLNVDEHDLWPGDICSVKAEEHVVDGAIYPKKLGVVQSADAKERIATVRWFSNPRIGVFEERRGVTVPGGSLGELSDEESSVSFYEVIVYPALTKGRGDIVLIAPNSHAIAKYPANARALASTGITVSAATDDLSGTDDADSSGERWVGDVIELQLNGLLTVRLGALDKICDVEVPVERVITLLSSYDGSFASGSSDYGSDGTGDDMSVDYGNEEVIEETVTYEGGARLDDGGEDVWMTDDDGDEDPNPHAVNNDDDDKPDRKTETPSENEHTDNSAPREARPKKTLPENHEEYRFQDYPDMPAQFLILDQPPPSDHHFLDRAPTLSASFLRLVRKEHKILESSLPPGIWVRAFADRLDLLRILIIGPRGTPYELAPFVLDFCFGTRFPHSPPEAYFHSWTNGVGRINPNLYEDGNVCLSILGTWPESSKEEGWSPEHSSMLQVIVSLLGLVLVERPYYNEAGFESLVGSEESQVNEKLYSEKALVLAKGFVAYALSHDIAALNDELSWVYLSPKGPRLLRTVVEESRALMKQGKAEEADVPSSEQRQRISAGALILLKRHYGYLEERLRTVSTDE